MSMGFPRRWIAPLCWITVGLCLALATGCGSQPAEPTTPADAPRARPSRQADNRPSSEVGNCLDLQAFANEKLATSGGNDLSELPTGVSRLQKVDFKIGPGILQLCSLQYPDYPSEITDIAVGLSFGQLHLLHGSQGGSAPQPRHEKFEADGSPIGRYVVHYEDGSQETIPILYGKDLRGLWNWDGGMATPRAEIAWRGKNDRASRFRQTIRLYKSTWTNPYPEKKVSTIDFVSENAKAAAPFCVAMSFGAANSSSPPTTPTLITKDEPDGSSDAGGVNTTSTASTTPESWNATTDPHAANLNDNLISPRPLLVESVAEAGQSAVWFPTVRSPFVAISARGNGYAVFDLRSGTKTAELPAADWRDSFVQCNLSPDGRYLATLSTLGSGPIRVWDVPTGKVIVEEALDGAQRAVGVCFASDGRILIARSDTDQLMWTVRTSHSDAQQFSSPRDSSGTAPGGCTISPGGKYVLQSKRDELVVFDSATGEQVGTAPLPQRVSNCYGMSFSRDGTQLASLYGNRNGPAQFLVRHFVTGKLIIDKSLPPVDELAGRDDARKFAGQAITWLGDHGGWLLFGNIVLNHAAEIADPSIALGADNFTALDANHLLIALQDKQNATWKIIPVDSPERAVAQMSQPIASSVVAFAPTTPTGTSTPGNTTVAASPTTPNNPTKITPPVKEAGWQLELDPPVMPVSPPLADLAITTSINSHVVWPRVPSSYMALIDGKAEMLVGSLDPSGKTHACLTPMSGDGRSP